MKKFLIIFIIIVIVSVAGFRVYNGIVGDGSQAAEQSYVTVEGEQVKSGSISGYSVFTGSVDAVKTVNIMATVPAKVKTVDVAVGDTVVTGDQLFQLDTKDIETQKTQADTGLTTAAAGVEQAKIGITNAQNAQKQADIGYDMAKANYDSSVEKYQFAVDNLGKYKQLYDQGIVSESEYKQMELQASPSTLDLINKQLEQAQEAKDQAALGIENAKLALTQAQAAYTQAQQGLNTATDAFNDMTFTAPIDGVVSSVNVVEDNYASSAQAAVVIDDINQVDVALSVTESVVNKLEKGQSAEVTISAIGDNAYDGVIKTISPSANQMTLLYAVTVEVQNPEHVIKPGMFADVKLMTDHVDNTRYVKSDSVIYKGDKMYVYVQNGDDKVELKEITAGIDNGDYIEITSGLKADDIYIYKGTGFIDQDSIIKMVRGDI